MGKNKDEIIVKYTLMPFNNDDDYEHYFSLSLREFAKNTKDKSLLAPLIVYNSDLDVPMDNDLEDYTVYCNKDQIIEVIRKKEINDVFRTLILHGFDISIDDLKETYITIARRNQADLCINVIQDTGIDSNITLYIDQDIENSEGKLWDLQKKEMFDEIDNFIKNYESYDYFDYSDEDIEQVENFLETLLNECGIDTSTNKRINKQDKKEENHLTLITPQTKDEQEDDLELEEQTIAFSFEVNDDVIRISCVDEELYIIEENDYEVALNKKQMEFIIESYHRINDLLEDNKPRK